MEVVFTRILESDKDLYKDLTVPKACITLGLDERLTAKDLEEEKLRNALARKLHIVYQLIHDKRLRTGAINRMFKSAHEAFQYLVLRRICYLNHRINAIRRRRLRLMQQMEMMEMPCSTSTPSSMSGMPDTPRRPIPKIVLNSDTVSHLSI